VSQSEAPQPLTVDGPDEALFRATVRAFARETVAPRVRAMDQVKQIDGTIFEALFRLGLMGIEIPTAFGGAGATFTTSLIAIEELAAVDASVSVGVDVQNTLVNTAVLRWGTDAQRRRHLPRLATDTLASYCLSEPGSGSDAFALATRATRDGGHHQQQRHQPHGAKGLVVAHGSSAPGRELARFRRAGQASAGQLCAAC
jgi:alkylation response protein AidB-like acyl-CoA dehydrogenase